MLVEASNPGLTALAALGDAWLVQGATAFSISVDGMPIVSLPSHASIRRPDLAAAIRRGQERVGEIRINGQDSPAARARLAADARLVGQLLEAEADLAAITDELVQVQDHLLAVYDLAQATRRRLDVPETLAALAQAAARLLQVEGAAVLLAPDGRDTAQAQYPPGSQERAWLEGLLLMLASREQVLLWQGRDLSDQLPGEMRSLLITPIEIGGKTQAALVAWSEHDERFASPEIKLARAIAEHGGAQIESALRYRDSIARARIETEMALARRVQVNLLPKAPPLLPGLDLYACSRHALDVGGDFFDFVAGPGRSTAFLVGDVSGKGLSAALVMTMTRTVLRSVIGHSRKSSGPTLLPTPAALLSLVNEELYDDLSELSMFATIFAASYDPGSRRIAYANAGHSPVIYMPVRGLPGLLMPDSVPIGVLRSTNCVDRMLEIGPGDVLVIASDGFNESRNHADELFGIERMMAFIQSNAHLPADALGQALFAAVEAYVGAATREDDQTLVIAKGVAG